MPKMEGIKRVLVIGSGPIVIGQAAEFDYAGTQACRSLKEEGMEVILVNSNPATIMTDKDIADKVYIEPLTTEVLQHIIEVEKPDSLLPNMGGQAGLNLGMELAESGFLESHGVRLLGTTAETIRNAEGRQEFKDLMERIGEPCASSELVENIEDGIKFANKIGYPVVLAQKVDDTFKKPTRMAVSFCVTDEIFAVSVSRNKTVSKYYMLGIISVSYIGWIAGTAFGALLGGILPAVISDALGIAIYGMFLAIILPAARDDSRFLKVIIIAVVLSCMFRWIPVLNKVSSGFVIIICAVAASAVGAWLYPIDEEEGN